jgi:peptidoglycan hydrolase-like protein with peptidoglycan-binding domain
MKPFWARLVFLGFMALTSAITFNALYMQGKRPPPLAMLPATHKEAPPGQKPVEDKVAVVEAGQSTPATAALGVGVQAADPTPPPITDNTALAAAHAGTEPVATRTVQAILRELKRRGYRPGPNGDPATKAAIISAEFDHHLPLTGEPSEALLKAVLFAAAKGGKLGNVANDKFEKNQELVREVQAILASLGFSSATADGAMSQGTRDAIKRFEASRKLPESGKLGEKLLLEIIAVSGRRIGSSG